MALRKIDQNSLSIYQLPIDLEVVRLIPAHIPRSKCPNRKCHRPFGFTNPVLVDDAIRFIAGHSSARG
jgi:hypothetical protein